VRDHFAVTILYSSEPNTYRWAPR